MEAAANPYQTPEGDLQQGGDDTPAEVSVFSPSGRIGRLRYLAYGTAMALVSYAIMAVPLIMMLGSNGSESAAAVFGIVNGLIGLVSLAIGIIWMIKRLHDVDKTGWLSLLIIIPLVNLIFVLYLLFAPGTSNSNRFGPPPVPNTTGVKILAFIFPVLMILGIVAAIVIPMAAQ